MSAICTTCVKCGLLFQEIVFFNITTSGWLSECVSSGFYMCWVEKILLRASLLSITCVSSRLLDRGFSRFKVTRSRNYSFFFVAARSLFHFIFLALTVKSCLKNTHIKEIIIWMHLLDDNDDINENTLQYNTWATALIISKIPWVNSCYITLHSEHPPVYVRRIVLRDKTNPERDKQQFLYSTDLYHACMSLIDNRNNWKWINWSTSSMGVTYARSYFIIEKWVVAT